VGEYKLERDGFCMLFGAVAKADVRRLLDAFDEYFASGTNVAEARSVSARSSRGHVYAARNLIRTIPEVATVWHPLSPWRLSRTVKVEDPHSTEPSGLSV
jgi:hypothetical protein